VKTIPFLALLITTSALAQVPSTGIQKDPHGVTITTGSGITRVEIWSANIVRVTHGATAPPPPTASLTVIAHPGSLPWKLADRAGDLVLSTPRLQVHVNRTTGAVRFLDEHGAVILGESPDGASWRPATVGGASTLAVQQTFALDPAEAIYGLGQHEDGVMNYVGTRVHLQQKNRDVAVPVLLSSKGYAVLWDNPAITDVDAGKTDKSLLTWSSEAGNGVDYYFLYGPDPDKAIAAYRRLTGAAPMFARWGWGF